MTVLHLGVTDIPYSVGRQTTGEVAEWLENRYHVMQHFLEAHGEEVAGALENAMAGALETVAMGGPVPDNPLAGTEGDIEEEFRRFVESGEMDRLGYPGIPTQAALNRASGRKRSLRFSKAKATGAAVSFVDSGLYVNSFKVWVD